MAFNMLAAKISINAAINFSTCGDQKQAIETFNNFPLNEDQNTAIKKILAGTYSKAPHQCMAEKVKILSILSSPPKPLAKPTVAVIARNTQGYNWETVKINFFRKELIGNAQVGNTPSADQLEHKSVNMRCYNDYDKLMSDFNFSSNGFQYCKVTDNLLDCLHSFSQFPSDEKVPSNLSKAALSFMTSWGKTNGIKFDRIIPFKFIYRDTNPETTSVKPYHLAHIDFQPSDISALKIHLKDPNEEIVLVVNLWMPLNEKQPRNTLALLDSSTTDPSAFQPYKAPGDSVASLTLPANDRHQWVTCDVMTKGKCVTFGTCSTVHSAGKLSSGIKGRQSLENRYMFIKSRVSVNNS